MNNESSGCSKFLGSAVLAGVVAIIGLGWAVYTFYQNNQDTQRELDNQAVQISQQQTQIALAEQQIRVNSDIATLQASTPNSTLAATSVATRVAELEGTAIALSTMQSVVKATEQAIPKTELLYEDTFDISSGWNLKDGVKIENGNLIVSPGRDAVPNSSTVYADFTFESRFYIPTMGAMAFYLRNQIPTCQNGSWNCSVQIVLDFKNSNQIFVARRSMGNTLSPIDISRNSTNVLYTNNWNEILVTAKGNNYKVYINRSPVLEFTDDGYASGSFIVDNDPNSNSAISIDYIRIYSNK